MSLGSYLDQRIENMRLYLQCLIGRGRITLVDDTKVIQFIQATINANEIIDNLPHMGEYGFVSNPPVGSDILAVFLSGDRSNGAVIGTNNQTARMKNLLAGESAMHDDIGKYIYLSATGLVVNAGGQPVIVNNATTVTINASGNVIMNTTKLLVNGPIEATGIITSHADIVDNTGSNSESVANMRSIYNSHIHSDPQGGNVSTPTPTM